MVPISNRREVSTSCHGTTAMQSVEREDIARVEDALAAVDVANCCHISRWPNPEPYLAPGWSFISRLS